MGFKAETDVMNNPIGTILSNVASVFQVEPIHDVYQNNLLEDGSSSRALNSQPRNSPAVYLAIGECCSTRLFKVVNNLLLEC